MAIQFSPTRKDVGRYLRLREVGRKLNSLLVKTIPRKASEDIAAALGFLRNGVIVIPNEDTGTVLADCCLYDWYEDEKNLIQRYTETNPAEPGTDEDYVLNAYRQARYAVLGIETVVAGVGISCRDLLNHEELFVTDLGLSQASDDVVLATRIIPLGEYWMTGGVGLALPSPEVFNDAITRVERGPLPPLMQGRRGVSLRIIRACLDARAREPVADDRPKGRGPRHITRRNRHKR